MKRRVLIGRIASAKFEECQHPRSDCSRPLQLGLAYAWARSMAPSAVKDLDKGGMSQIFSRST